MKTLLLVEDDRRLADALTMNLEAAGYMVAQVHDGESVVGEFGRGVFDLILLDIMLPGIDGLTICRRLRGTGITTPILFITARDDTDTRIEGLLSGGDDYITKLLISENCRRACRRFSGARRGWPAGTVPATSANSPDEASTSSLLR